ncbi:MAG: hypothetical protein L3J62_05190 [Gammaproteobacteria bacterium]|nr:hypothetical protein [Gammaproteobacteria bacterium]MCF6230179.1 hypothetical protein [Gammaproteobacteria bacterium]
MVIDHEQAQELHKQREIKFFEFHPDPDQCGSAQQLLSHIAEIEQCECIAPRTLSIRYDLRHITLEVIELLLEELGYHLETGLLYKLSHALYYYTEQVQRDNLGISNNSAVDTKMVFMNRYQHLLHGCRDNRPEHLRHYK